MSIRSSRLGVILAGTLGIVTVVAWAASHLATWSITFGGGGVTYLARSSDGVISIGWATLPSGDYIQGLHWGFSYDPVSMLQRVKVTYPIWIHERGAWVTLGDPMSRSWPWNVRVLLVPHWFLTLLVGIIVIAGLRRGRKKMPPTFTPPPGFPFLPLW